MAQYFSLTLDTKAPENGVLSGLSAYYNGAATVTISADNASYMKVWVDQKSTGDAADAPSSWSAYATSQALTPSTEGTNYFHAMFMDEVGNIGVVVDSESFIYDITAPTISKVENSARVKVKNVDVKVTFSDLKTGIDAVSGVNTITVTGTDSHIAAQTFTLDDTDRANGYKTCNVALTITAEEEAAKAPVTCSFGVVAADRAGNTSSSTSASVIYDAFPASATMTLMDKTCTSSLPAYVNSADYGIQITSSDTDIAYYKVWEGSTEPSTWESWTGSPLNLTNLVFNGGYKIVLAKGPDTQHPTYYNAITITKDSSVPQGQIEITGTGNADYCYITINQVKYYTAQTITFNDNDTLAAVCYGHDEDDPTIKFNGSNVGTWEEDPGRLVFSTTISTAVAEGLKTINGKIKDTTGNETSLTSVSTTYDITAPVVTLSSDVNIISAQSGYDTVTFTYAATDAHSMPSYKLLVDDVVIKQGTFTTSMTEAVTEAEIVAKSAGQGQKSFVLEVTDVAGNAGTSSALVVTVDLTAPTGTVTAADYYKAGDAVTVTLSATDTGGSTVSKMKVWTGSSEPSAWETYATSKTFTGLADGSYTVSAKYADAVGNIMTTAATDTFIVDVTAPVISSVALDNVNAGYTKVTEHTATITASDATSGLKSMKIWGDIVGASTEPTAWEDFASTKSITLTTGDGTKHVYVKVLDNAGNESTTYDYSVILDQQSADVSVSLFKADGTTVQPSITNVRPFVAHIAAEDTYEAAGLQFKLTGDFATQITDWTDYVEKSVTEKYMVIDNLTATEGDGLKTVTVLFKDTAGNESTASASFTLDQTAPSVTVTDPNYNKISTQHSKRLDATGTEKTGDNEYNDVVIFKFQADEDFQQYKVCVNAAEQTAAAAVAIGTTYGSQNMSGTKTVADPYPKQTDISCTLFGKDFAVAMGEEATVTGKVIAKEVIIYVLDLGGTWSAVHVIS